MTVSAILPIFPIRLCWPPGLSRTCKPRWISSRKSRRIRQDQCSDCGWTDRTLVLEGGRPTHYRYRFENRFQAAALCGRGSQSGFTGEAPDSERVFAEHQFPLTGREEIQITVYEFQFFVHRQLPARPRVPGAPYQLLRAELLVYGLKERECVLVRIIFRNGQLIWLRRADPD